MLSLAIVCVSLTAAGPSADDLASYRKARAEAGRDAVSQTKLALWCEGHGLTAEKAEHLALAAMADPSSAAIRGLMGLVPDGRAWRSPEDLAEKVQADARLSAALASYQEKRARTPETAEAQWKLGIWCEENGLDAEARAHFTGCVRLDPSREAAWKRLGYKKVGGRWATDAQVAAEKAESEAQKKADRDWRNRLEKMRAELNDPRKKDRAQTALAGVSDPRALPGVLRVFGNGDASRLVQILGQIASPDSSRALAVLAIYGPTAGSRAAAVETLRRRDPREFASLWIDLIRKPLKYEVRPVGGPGSPGALFVEGEQFNRQRIYAPPSLNLAIRPGDTFGTGADGLPTIFRTVMNSETEITWQQARADLSANNQTSGPTLPVSSGNLYTSDAATAERTVVRNARQFGGSPLIFQDQSVIEAIPVGRMALETQKAAAVAEGQLEADVAAIQAGNESIRASNDRVVGALRDATGQDIDADAEAWRSWFADRRGYAYTPPTQMPLPTIVENVPLAYQPQPIAPSFSAGPTSYAVERHSCFAAGTVVTTRVGPKPIERVTVGDVVLTRDTSTGSLSFQPVLAAYHNPPASTFRVDLGDDAIVATGIHRFWKAGSGWTMARDLKTGDLVRTVSGVLRVQEVRPERIQPVFNLEVAGGHDFFVGKAGAMVHDNSLVRPVASPFDSAELAKLDAKARP